MSADSSGDTMAASSPCSTVCTAASATPSAPLIATSTQVIPYTYAGASVTVGAMSVPRVAVRPADLLLRTLEHALRLVLPAAAVAAQLVDAGLLGLLEVEAVDSFGEPEVRVDAVDNDARIDRDQLD